MPLLDRDLVMVRARVSDPSTATDSVDHLTDPTLLSGEQFHCNRIVALTGTAEDPGISTEYFDTLGDDSRVWEITPDWERSVYLLGHPDTDGADAVDPEPEWTPDFATNVQRVGPLADAIHAEGKRAGLAPAPKAWDFGQFAIQARLDNQLVQIQYRCVLSPASFARRAAAFVHQYRSAGLRTSNVGVEVSFSAKPGTTDLPADVTPERAAECTSAAYASGVRAVLLWAQPDVLRRYFAALPDSIRG